MTHLCNFFKFRSLGLCLVLASIAAGGCARETGPPSSTPGESSRTEVIGESTGDISPEAPPPVPPEPPSETGPETSRDPLAYQIPAGSPGDLVEFINAMASGEPRGETPDEKTADVGRMMDARIRAAEMLLQEATREEFGTLAAKTKLESLRVLRTIGREGAKAQFVSYANELAADADEAVARTGRIGHFQGELDNVMMIETEDASAVVAALEELLGREQLDRELMDVVSEAASLLLVADKQGEAHEALLKIGESFADHADEELAAKARAALQRAELVNFQLLLNDFRLAGVGTQEDLVAQAQSLLNDPQNSTALLTIMDEAEQLEFAGRVEVAQALYGVLQDALQNRTGPGVSERFEEQLAAAVRRVELLGQPFEIEGQLLNGERLDWSAYRGKVVLVDFWATWCQPCIRELPNVRAQYDKYHDRGFDVVGVNLDENREVVEQFLTQRQLPWASLVNASSEEMEFRDPNAERYGVAGIPFLVLVDRDGTVAGLHLRGELLGRRLAQMFGEGSLEPAHELPASSAATKETDEAARGDEAEDSPADSPAAAASGRIEDGPQPAAARSTVAGNKDVAAAEEQVELSVDQEINPYAPPPGLSPLELADFLIEMQDRPLSIQRREGFRDGICLAADALLSTEAPASQRTIAALAKFHYLHRDACLGDDEAQRLLQVAVAQLQQEQEPEIAAEVRFLQLEQRALDAEQLPPTALPALIDTVTEYLRSAGESLTGRHLRIASATVAAINRLEEADVRERKLSAVGRALSASNDKAVAKYGQRLSGQNEARLSALIGKPFELSGTTLDGDEFAWEDYRGQVVLVNFWASWCGPCRAAIPQLQALLDAHGGDGLKIVGVCLDEDDDAGREFLTRHNMPWSHLSAAAGETIADRYDVHGIPMMVLVDREGLARGLGTDIAALHETIDKLLGTHHGDDE